MENSYGIGVENRYALFLDEEEDPLEVLKNQEKEKEAKKKTKLSEKENEGKVVVAATEPKGKVAEVKGKQAAAPRKGIKETQNVKPDASKPSGRPDENNRTRPAPAGDRAGGERNKPRNYPPASGEPREERNNRYNREERPTGDRSDRPPRGDNQGRTGEDRRGGRGMGSRGTDRPPRGAGAPRGERGGYDNRGKREFDRQSGSDRTGVKAVDKREGRGPHNWGNARDDVAQQLNTSAEEPADWSGEKPADWAGDKAETEAPPPAQDNKEGEVVEEAPPVVEEPVELTLDEYKALRSVRQKPTYNLRKAGEGEDLSQWKPMYEVPKKNDVEEQEEDDEEYEVAEYPQRVGRQKHVLDIDIHFADNRRGGSGPRGGGRGGRGGRGGPRGGFRGGDDGGERGPREPRGPPTPRGDRDGERGGEDRGGDRGGYRGNRGGGGFRGDRGGDRGGNDRFRGGERGGETYAGRTPRQTAPKVDDVKAFPSLG